MNVNDDAHVEILEIADDGVARAQAQSPLVERPEANPYVIALWVLAAAVLAGAVASAAGAALTQTGVTYGSSGGRPTISSMPWYWFLYPLANTLPALAALLLGTVLALHAVRSRWPRGGPGTPAPQPLHSRVLANTALWAIVGIAAAVGFIGMNGKFQYFLFQLSLRLPNAPARVDLIAPWSEVFDPLAGSAFAAAFLLAALLLVRSAWNCDSRSLRTTAPVAHRSSLFLIAMTVVALATLAIAGVAASAAYTYRVSTLTHIMGPNRNVEPAPFGAFLMPAAGPLLLAGLALSVACIFLWLHIARRPQHPHTGQTPPDAAEQS